MVQFAGAEKGRLLVHGKRRGIVGTFDGRGCVCWVITDRRGSLKF